MPVQRHAIEQWVNEVSALTNPDRVVYCDGSERESNELIQECLVTGELIALNQKKMPGCYLHRSASHDVARTEHLTFISTEEKEDAGPNNNWMSPAEARARLTPLFKDAMKGRTMYVVPYLMGPMGSSFSQVGVEVTDHDRRRRMVFCVEMRFQALSEVRTPVVAHPVGLSLAVHDHDEQLAAVALVAQKHLQWRPARVVETRDRARAR